ncbi:MAG: DUF4136 domain-containing protein [Candidatus Acidiferrales bacterium]
MKKTSIFLGLLAALLLVSTAAYAQKVNVDFDRDADFSKYTTFAVAFDKSEPPRDPLMAQRAFKGVSYHLTLKGLREVEESPEVVVVLYGIREQEQQINITSTGYAYGPGWGWGGGWGGWGGGSTMATTSTYMIGTLVVDMYDAKTKQIVWRGVGTDTLSDKPEKNEKKLNKALEKMFKKYPPTKKK